jgi:hypothetical protein
VPDFHRQNTIASTDPLLAINENSARVPCSLAHEWGPIRRGHHRLKLVLLQSKTETLDCSTEISFPAKKNSPRTRTESIRRDPHRPSTIYHRQIILNSSFFQYPKKQGRTGCGPGREQRAVERHTIQTCEKSHPDRCEPLDRSVPRSRSQRGE